MIRVYVYASGFVSFLSKNKLKNSVKALPLAMYIMLQTYNDITNEVHNANMGSSLRNA